MMRESRAMSIELMGRKQATLLRCRTDAHRAGSRIDRHRRGYTLVELLIVVAMLGLAATVLIPYMVDQHSFSAQAAVRKMISDIAFAQSDAVAHQGMRRVQFLEDGKGYCLVEVDSSTYDDEFDDSTAVYLNDPIAQPGSLQQYIVDFSTDERFTGISIESVDLDDEKNYLTFDEMGGTLQSGNNPGTGGEIVLASEDGEKYRLSISPFTGKMTVALIVDEEE